MNDLPDLLDTAAIFRYHHSLTEKYGSGTTSALGWLQHEGQQARFEMLSRIGNMDNCSVLDAGCGHADLLPFLKSCYENVNYYGLEQMPELLTVATQRYQHEKTATFLSGDFMKSPLPVTDYVLACGSLSYRHHNKDFIFKAVEQLFSHCHLGAGFNLLSGGVPEDSLLIAYSPDEIYRFCKTLSPETTLHQGYWDNDFTIFMYQHTDSGSEK
jgi:SAM-dependent methyltransferase